MAKRTTDKHRAAWNISHEMADLLGWARHPSPEPLSPSWADAYKKNTVAVVEYALQVFESDDDACRKLKASRKLAFEFIALLANNPTLAVVPVHEWPVAAYRQLFDDLSGLEREFKILSNPDEQPAGKPANMEPVATPSDETLVSADQLGAFARVGGKVVRVALGKAGCRPWIKSTGKGNPHQWRYSDAIQSLNAVKSGKLRSFIWPDSAAEVMPQKDSSKIPARK